MSVPELMTMVTVPPEVRPYSAEYAEVSTFNSRMASAGGRICTPPVEPETTETPSTINSLLTVRLPLNESWLALMLVASPPEETPAVRESRLRMLRLGNGRSCTWEGVITFPRDEVSVASWPSFVPTTVTDSDVPPACSVTLILARWSTARLMPFTSPRLKPCTSTATLYRPARSSGPRYTPESFVTPLHTVMPVSALTMVTGALGTTACVESVTVPEMTPAFWATREADPNRRT